MNQPTNTDIMLERAAAALREARRVAVLTGAGMSAASGLPTYRGRGGLYNERDIDEGLAIEDILHAYTFARNPALTWKYIAQIAHAGHGARPNAGHDVLARWERCFDLWVITQNVDGLHAAAGSTRLVELHGNLGRLYCIDCREPHDYAAIDTTRLPPRCRYCDGLVRPDVVLFGELLPDTALSIYERELARGFDVILVIGTSAGFPYINEPLLTAQRRGTVIIEINPDETILSDKVDIRLAQAADLALSALDVRLTAADVR